MNRRNLGWMIGLLALLSVVLMGSLQTHGNGCKTIKLCDAVSANGDCAFVATWADGGYTHHIYSDASAGTATYTATICSSWNGSKATCNTLNPSVTVSDTATQNYWDGQLNYYWAKVSGYGGSGGVTVYDFTCPIAK